jgi:N-acetylglutamate synthase
MPMAGCNFEIGEMTAEALDEVLALWRVTEGVGLSEGDTKDDLTAFLARNPGLSLVARHDGRIVGAVLSGHDGRRGCLYHLAVAAPYRHKGIGRTLVETCVQRLASFGIRKCNIFLYNHNKIGQRFWNRNGWKERTDLKILQKVTSSPSLLDK